MAKYIAGMIFYKYLLDIKSGAAKILEDGTIISAFEKMLLTADYDTTYKDTRRYIQIQRERLLSDISKSALEKLNKDISNEFKNYKHYYELGRKILNASLSTMFVPIKKNKKTRTKS